MRRLAWIGAAVLGVSLMLPAQSYAGATPTALTLQKTVGVFPNGCAAPSQIVVNKGTPVFYCFKITNQGSFTLTNHTLNDDILGSLTSMLPSGGNFDLPPGQSFALSGIPVGGFVINANTVNVATWMAVGTPETSTAPSVAADIVTVTANGTAQVVIGAQAAPALGDAALAFVAAAMLLFGALRLSRRLRDQA